MPRHNMTIESRGRPIGRVTSGTYSPSLERPIGMGYVETPFASPDQSFEVKAGDASLPARVVRRPFYTAGSRRA